MIACDYCHKQVLPEHNLTEGANHQVCENELFERKCSDACVKCGKTNIVLFLGGVCGPCRDTSADYGGFLGLD